MNNDCVFDLRGKEVDRIILYADGEITFKIPMVVYRPTLTDSNQASEKEFVISPSAAEFEPDIRRDKIVLPTVEQQTGRMGVTFLVKQGFVLRRNSTTVYHQQISALMTGWYHMMIVFSDGMRAIARATEESYLLTCKEDNGEMSCEITIENVSGLQRIREVDEGSGSGE